MPTRWRILLPRTPHDLRDVPHITRWALAIRSRPSERSKRLQLSGRKVTHGRIEYLKDQLARAERLAKAILDQQTAQRLQALAAECRTELQVLTHKAAA
jgi:hypothetical protein